MEQSRDGLPRDTARFDPAPVEEALQRLENLGGTALVEKMIDAFLANAGRNVVAASTALDEGDASGIERAAHSLKSSAANLGAVRLRELAQDAERMAGSAEFRRELEWSVTALSTALDEVCRYLEVRKPQGEPER